MRPEATVNNSNKPWVGRCSVEFMRDKHNKTRHQGGCNAPLKLMGSKVHKDGRCELPILHTAGGLVGGDELEININLKKNSKSTISTVAAQKIYGSVKRSRIKPEGTWCKQTILINQEEKTDLEWLPQETIMYENSLYEQEVIVQLEPNSSFMSMDIVRLGRTAASESLKQGKWRSSLKIKRKGLGETNYWEYIDRTEVSQESLMSVHGLGGHPVVGCFVWVAATMTEEAKILSLLNSIRIDRNGLSGQMRCGQIRQGIVARYIGKSSRDARQWFTCIWHRTRNHRNMILPEMPRYWPLQEEALWLKNEP